MQMYLLVVDDEGGVEIQNAEGEMIHHFGPKTETAMEIVEALEE